MIEIEEPGLDANGYPKEESSIINIHAYSTNKEDVIRVANAVAHAYVMEVTSVTMTDSVQVLDAAYACEIEYNALKPQIIYIVIFLLIGLVFSCFIIICCEIFSTKILSLKQASLYGELEIMGVIQVQEK